MLLSTNHILSLFNSGTAFLTPKDDPHTERITFVIKTHNIGILMKRKELGTKTFMIISNCCEKPNYDESFKMFHFGTL